MTPDPEIFVLSTAGVTPPKVRRDGGAPPQLRWIEIDALFVDRKYQREIGKQSKANIARIAEKFDWAFFAPVVVAPLEGGDFFVVIDGQHRAAAAKLIGKPSVPCSIVTASRQKQAAAFGAINGVVTRVHTLQMHASALAAGDPVAVEIASIAAEAGVTILRTPRSAQQIKPGETTACASLKILSARFDRETVVRALLVITAGPRSYRGMLGRDMIEALCGAIQPSLGRQADLARFASINLGAIEQEARQALALKKGRLSLHLLAALKKRLGVVKPTVAA